MCIKVERHINLLLSNTAVGFEDLIVDIVSHCGIKDNYESEEEALLCLLANLYCNYSSEEVSTIPSTAREWRIIANVMHKMRWLSLERVNRIIRVMIMFDYIRPATSNKPTKKCPVSKYVMLPDSALIGLLNKCEQAPVYDIRYGSVDWDSFIDDIV